MMNFALKMSSPKKTGRSPSAPAPEPEPAPEPAQSEPDPEPEPLFPSTPPQPARSPAAPEPEIYAPAPGPDVLRSIFNGLGGGAIELGQQQELVETFDLEMQALDAQCEMVSEALSRWTTTLTNQRDVSKTMNFALKMMNFVSKI